MKTLRSGVLMLSSCLALNGVSAAAAVPGVDTDASGTPFISNIEQFLNGCPADDPATAQIRADFQIRRNGAVVAAINCTAPAAQMPIAQFTDELIVLQGLRVMYYMDRGHAGQLPWTPLTVYDWMKSQVQGIDVRDDATFDWCCYAADDKTFFVAHAQDDVQRNFDREWPSLSGNIGLYVHEARHLTGPPHSFLCGDPPGSMDQVYDESNLGSYGTQYVLNKLWLTGGINVGIACLAPDKAAAARDWFDSSANNTFHFRYCDNTPPLVPVPAVPGGPCRANVAPAWAPYTSYPAGARVTYDRLVYEAAQAHTSLPSWTPTQATNLWYRPTPTGTAPWEVQTKYVVGSTVTYAGATYTAITAHVSQSSWAPPLTPTLWRKQ